MVWKQWKTKNDAALAELREGMMAHRVTSLWEYIWRVILILASIVSYRRIHGLTSGNQA